MDSIGIESTSIVGKNAPRSGYKAFFESKYLKAN